MIKNVFFDLDGTLLPMDMRVFVEEYIRLLAGYWERRGKDPDTLVKAVWEGIGRMHENDGSETNEDVFWGAFGAVCPTGPGDREALDEFYRGEFQLVREKCGFSPMAAGAVRKLRAMGLRTVLATNPVFPREATVSRIRWAGLESEDFELITTYENSRFCKPDPGYYGEICQKLGMDPTQTLMVGNDTRDDTGGEALGMRTYLLTHSLIDRFGDMDSRLHGDFAGLLTYIKSNK